MKLVYVLDMHGEPLMPASRFGKVRRMLKSGLASVAKKKPFTIRLEYEPATHAVEQVVVGQDPGRTNIGLSAVRGDGTALLTEKCTTRNKEVPKFMAGQKRGRCNPVWKLKRVRGTRIRKVVSYQGPCLSSWENVML